MKITLVGYGRMGQLIHNYIRSTKIEVVSTIDPEVESSDYKSLSPEAVEDADVAIDYTTPDSVMNNINFYLDNELNSVIGTTGWYDHIEEVKNKFKNSQAGLIWAANFSIGVNLFFRIIDKSSKIMSDFKEYDVMGFEKHHNRKKDSPSGTMKMIGNIILKNIPRKKKLITDKLDRRINSDEIHLASMRGGEIPGTHSVEFDSEMDTIEIKHTARNRKGFITGTLKAAEWIKEKTGFYSINDMMDEIMGG